VLVQSGGIDRVEHVDYLLGVARIDYVMYIYILVFSSFSQSGGLCGVSMRRSLQISFWDKVAL
jgi:hypothetical protein